MPRPAIRVCFVCLGNICRSPTAEGVFRHLVEARGLADAVEIDSAGTAAHHEGERPDRRARAAARDRGIALEGRARQFRAEELGDWDYVLAMDRENLTDLRALPGAGDAPGELALLRRFDPLAPPDAEVPDPYYGGERGFEEVLDLCEAACRGLLDAIVERREAAERDGDDRG